MSPKPLPQLPPQTTTCAACPGRCESPFKAADEPTLRAIDELRTPCAYRAGELMEFSRAGRTGFFCVGGGYMVMSYARARVVRPLRVCGPGDLVGYGSWFWDDRCNAKSIEPVSACFFERDPFEALARTRPSITEELTKLLCWIILQKSERIVAMGNPSVRGRVAATLLSLERKFGVVDDDGSRIAPRVARETLARLAGTVVESLSRALTELESDEVLLRRRKSIIIRDTFRLERIAYGTSRRNERTGAVT